MKICVAGAGALGSTFGGTLAAGGCDVLLVGRNADHVHAVNRDGLVMVEAGRERTVPVKASTSATGFGAADLVIVLVKSADTAAAVETARDAIGPATAVISLQNGLGHEDILCDAVGRGRVLAGKTYVGGVFLGPGRVRCGVAGKETVIGELDGGGGARAGRIAEAMTAAGLSTTISADIVGTMWDKLLVNVAGGALTAITGLTYGGLYSLPVLEECALAAVAEAIAVARANGVALTTRDPRDAWRKAADGLPPEFKTSMLQSRERGATTGVDFIHGAVVRWGGKAEVPTPVNSTLVACVKGIEYAATSYPGKA